MEIIKTYLENLFASLPKTKEVLKMKADLLANMLDKYEELKKNGKTENEAIGIVISEFGNIDEIAAELGIDLTNNEVDETPVVTSEIAESFISVTKKMGRLVALGVMICILSPVTLILLSSSGKTFDVFIGLTVLFIMVATAVGLFIYSGMKMEKFNYLRNKIYIPQTVKEDVQKDKEAFDNKFVITLIVSIVLYILSPTFLIGSSILDENNEMLPIYGVGVLLGIVAIATFIIVRFGIIHSAYSLLLRLGDYARVGTRTDKLINAIAGIYWPLVVGFYLLWSFTKGSWGISWIVFPIAGVIFGAIDGIIKAIKKD